MSSLGWYGMHFGPFWFGGLERGGASLGHVHNSHRQKESVVNSRRVSISEEGRETFLLSFPVQWTEFSVNSIAKIFKHLRLPLKYGFHVSLFFFRLCCQYCDHLDFCIRYDHS
eukprot:4971190-Amphidinium_carterae.1